MKVVYQAFDGELFETEKECLDYEDRKKRLEKEFFVSDDLQFFNEQGERMSGTLEEMINECDFFAVVNEHGVKLLEYIDDKGFLTPKGIGLWFFDDIGCFDNDWVEVHNPETVPKILVQYIREKS